MQDVRLIAVSDLHGCTSFWDVAETAIRQSANIVVVAGDVQTAYRDRVPSSAFHDDFIKPVLHLCKFGIEVVLTPGNHDFYLRKCLGANNRRRFTSNLHVLCDRGDKILGLKFYGTPWVPTINGQWCYEEDDELLMQHFERIPGNLDVLVAHSPPLGILNEQWDVSMQNDPSMWTHFGSSALRRIVERKRPRCVVCGHIHTGDHGLNVCGSSALVNVSMIDERYQKAFDPAEILFDKSGEMSFKTSGEKEWKNLKSISRKCAY